MLHVYVEGDCGKNKVMKFWEGNLRRLTQALSGRPVIECMCTSGEKRRYKEELLTSRRSSRLSCTSTIFFSVLSIVRRSQGRSSDTFTLNIKNYVKCIYNLRPRKIGL